MGRWTPRSISLYLKTIPFFVPRIVPSRLQAGPRDERGQLGIALVPFSHPSFTHILAIIRGRLTRLAGYRWIVSRCPLY